MQYIISRSCFFVIVLTHSLAANSDVLANLQSSREAETLCTLTQQADLLHKRAAILDEREKYLEKQALQLKQGEKDLEVKQREQQTELRKAQKSMQKQIQQSKSWYFLSGCGSAVLVGAIVCWLFGNTKRT